MATQATKIIKVVEVGHPDGTVTREDFAKEDFAHRPSDDPATWYLPMRRYPEDAMPDADCLLHAVDVLKRAEFSPAQARLSRLEIPHAKYRVAEAWRQLFGETSNVPDVLLDGTAPDESEAPQ